MDPHLQNAWGVTKLPGSPLWVADCNYRLYTLYDGRVRAVDQKENAYKSNT
jgi:hypothetical protein